MGARGPAPTPTETLKARGSWRAKTRQGEVEFPRGTPTCPSWLTTEAKAEWKRQCKALAAAGILSEVDRSLLAAYCEAWGEFAGVCYEISEMVRAERKTGYSLAIAAGLVSAKNKAADRLLRLAQQFGFSPSARTRIKAVEAGDSNEPEEAKGGKGKSRFFGKIAGKIGG